MTGIMSETLFAESTLRGCTSCPDTVKSSTPTSTHVGSQSSPGGSYCTELSVEDDRESPSQSPWDIHILREFLYQCREPDIDENSEKLLLRSFELLQRCGYSPEDICTVLAHASSYFLDAYDECGADMDTVEVGNLMVLLLYIAHSYVLDETCPLGIWHKHLFNGYCSLRELDGAIVRFMALREYILRLDDDELEDSYDSLICEW
eukprot:CAMPEP_0170581896 /NCGR_PEP_ID=MMETSP0224-20130122/7289_1 /TAXON_ID=285029 /ORGANISM="Togula jolla, Strain CCCM 725" /LENGTH=204 /DNA_ID=CAMNT_0010905073 /DNA_START=180 /DNA_END=791 /DNA_ORIENTATION=-